MKHFCLVSRKRKLHCNRCDIVQCIVICLFEVISNKSHTFPCMVMVDIPSIFLIVIFLIGMECLNLIRLICLFCWFCVLCVFTYTINYSFAYYLQVRFLFFLKVTQKRSSQCVVSLFSTINVILATIKLYYCTK